VVDHEQAADLAEQRAVVADERAGRADDRATQARQDAKHAKTDEMRRHHLREAELHFDAANAMRGAADLQREHAQHERAAAAKRGEDGE